MTKSSMQGPSSDVADVQPSASAPGDAPRPRCVLVVNPYSSGMTSRRERTIVTILREHLDLDVRRTERGGHAPKIAREIVAADTHDVIISCGGDGTANEVLNGMSLAKDTAGNRPRIAILPAGGTNVVARSLGFANHPIKAARELAEAIVDRRSLRVNLATVDERIFMFSAGVGIDAEVVKRMSERRSGRRPSDTAHLASLFGIYATSRFALGDRMTITIDETDEELRSALLIVGNMTPMTYIGRFPMHFLPDCRLEGGLDLLAPQRANAFYSIRNALQAVGVGRSKQRLVNPEMGQVRHDIAGFHVNCDEPEPVQVDGEYIGERTHLTFGLLERAVDIVA